MPYKVQRVTPSGKVKLLGYLKKKGPAKNFQKREKSQFGVKIRVTKVKKIPERRRTHLITRGR